MFMKHRLACVAALLAAAACSAQESPQAVRKEADAALRKWGRSMESVARTKSATEVKAAVEALFTTDCVSIWADGSPVRGRVRVASTFLNWMKEVETMKRFAGQTLDLSLRPDGTAVSTAKYEVTYTTRDAATGASHAMVATGRERDTWVKTPQGWRIRRAQCLWERITRDGQLQK